MKFNFRKISTIVASAVMVCSTMGMAAAANYPNPFVVGGTANVAVVYGTGAGVSSLDQIQSGYILANLQSYMGASTGTTASVSGEAVSLDTSSTRIWLNTSLNTAKSTLTKTDLPTVLGDSTFSGNVDAKLTSTIKILGGADAGGDNSDKVIFAKQPRSSDDPEMGISLGASTQPIYNASVTMKAVNFSDSDSEGETITLFGKSFVISTATTNENDLVLFSSAEEVTLCTGTGNCGDTPASVTVTINGTEHDVTLAIGTSTTATVNIDGDSKEITEGNSKKVGGIDVAVKSVTESTATATTVATLLVGSEKITFTAGSTVTKGSDDDPVDGTRAYVSGTPGACTELAVAIYRPDSSNDAILPGESFVDPVFGSFKVDFVGLSSPLDDANRETITVDNSGDDSMTVSFTDSDGNSGTMDFAHNVSSRFRLADDSNYTLFPYEMANLTDGDYVVLGNEDYGHLLQVIRIYNNTGTTASDDQIKLQDVISGDTYTASITSECMKGAGSCGTISIDGKSYEVNFLHSDDDGWVQLKYPTGDSSSDTTFVMYPTIKTSNGALLAFYEPLTFDLDDFNQSNGGETASVTFNFPDGDGYTAATMTHIADNGTVGNWTMSTAGTGSLCTGPCSTTDTIAKASSNGTIGQLTYSFTTSSTINRTTLYLVEPEGSTLVDNPAIILFEGKDDNNQYHAVIIDLETAPDGTSTDPAGVSDVFFSQHGKYGHYSASLASDSDITKDIDWWGTLATIDANTASQKSVVISYPSAQVYAQIYLGEESSAVTSGISGGATALGDVLVKDSEVSSVSTKNLIVVGGSCINSAAATLVGGAYCGAGWTEATGVGSGEFLIKSYSSSSITSKIALLVAGYEAADTVNAATYLRTKTVDTSKEYKGTSSTSAELVTTEE